ncbi:cytochrome c [Caulobacter sp. 1776]|uniref:c-type cytochrome n=1 Tax=Caulobacter sp. 1776 TaxID=3156420 RepID=UPI00339379A7
MIVTAGGPHALMGLRSAADAVRPWRGCAQGAVLGMILLALAGPVSASAAPPDPAPADVVGRGRAIVQRDCAGCHAVERTGDSPNPKAPRFRRLHERYDVDALGEALAEGLTVGHGPMPEWSFGPTDTAAILAYLKSLEAPARSKPKRGPAI